MKTERAAVKFEQTGVRPDLLRTVRTRPSASVFLFVSDEI